MSSPAPTLAPTLPCGGCQATLELRGKRIGDSVTCGCGRVEVITRLKVPTGDLPPAKLSGGLSAQERGEVDEALRRIKLRRVGQAARNVELYPTWAMVLAIGQLWLAGILAGHNLKATGQAERGTRIQITGFVVYVLLNASFLGALLFFREQISPVWGAPLLVSVPLVCGGYFLVAQGSGARAAREAGARQASVWLPFLLGTIIAIAQAFLARFLALRFDAGF